MAGGVVGVRWRDFVRIDKGLLRVCVMTRTRARRIMCCMTDLAPGWGETGLLIWSIRHLSHVLFPSCVRSEPFLTRLSGGSSHAFESGTGIFGQRVCPNLDRFR